jgi:hypothetical protein
VVFPLTENIVTNVYLRICLTEPGVVLLAKQSKQYMHDSMMYKLSIEKRDLPMQWEKERNIDVSMLTCRYMVYKTSICVFCEEPFGSFPHLHVNKHKLNYCRICTQVKSSKRIRATGTCYSNIECGGWVARPFCKDCGVTHYANTSHAKLTHTFFEKLKKN